MDWAQVMKSSNPEVTKTSTGSVGHSWNETTATAVEETSKVAVAEVEAAIVDYKARLTVHEQNLAKLRAATKRLVTASETMSKELTKTAQIIRFCRFYLRPPPTAFLSNQRTHQPPSYE